MRIVIDRNIRGAERTFARLGDLVEMEGRAIRREHLLDADLLIIRTATKANAELLEGTPVRFVGTTSIGTDHLDIPWLEQAGIARDALYLAWEFNIASVENITERILHIRDEAFAALKAERLKGVNADPARLEELEAAFTAAKDAARIAWGAGDVVDGRPPLSRWHPDWADAAKAAGC